MSASKIAYLRQQIALEYEAAQRGLSELASGVARHDFIAARTENISLCHDQLIDLVGPDTAIAMVANSMWSPIDQGIAP